jgi:hypothetical protein
MAWIKGVLQVARVVRCFVCQLTISPVRAYNAWMAVAFTSVNGGYRCAETEFIYNS